MRPSSLFADRSRGRQTARAFASCGRRPRDRVPQVVQMPALARAARHASLRRVAPSHDTVSTTLHNKLQSVRLTALRAELSSAAAAGPSTPPAAAASPSTPPAAAAAGSSTPLSRPPKWSFHRRKLQAPLVPLSSDEGRQMFASGLAAGTHECYFPLVEQFMTHEYSYEIGRASCEYS